MTDYSIFYTINIIIHTLVYIFFIIAPFKKKLRHSVGVTVIIALLYLIFVAVLIGFFFEKNSPLKGNFFILVMWVILTIVLCVFIIKGNPMQMVFLVFVTFNIQNHIIVMANVLNGLGVIPQMKNFEFGTYLLLTLIVLTIYIPIMIFIYFNLFKKVIDTNINFTNWKYLWLIPVSVFVFGKVSSYGGIDFYAISYTFRDLATILVLSGMSIIAYSISLQMLLRTYDSLKATQSMELANTQLGMQKNRYKLITNSVEQSAKLRHDWRHHMRILLDYADNNKLEEIKTYLRDYNQENELKEEIQFCENMAVDSVLRYHYATLQNANIDSDFKVVVPQNIGITDMDLCVVFGNLMENAVEACVRQKSGKKFFKLRSNIIGKQLLIEFINSFEGEIDDSQEVYMSRKRDGLGIGISSVKSIVEKSSGFLTIKAEDQAFIVKVMLNI